MDHLECNTKHAQNKCFHISFWTRETTHVTLELLPFGDDLNGVHVIGSVYVSLAKRKHKHLMEELYI